MPPSSSSQPGDLPRFISQGKHDFSSEYNNPSPRPLISVYRDLDYVVPYHVEHFIDALVAKACETASRSHATLIDIGCSYGINALLLKHGVSYEKLTGLILDPNASDRQIIGSLRKLTAKKSRMTVIGTDTSTEAINFCKAINVQDGDLLCNLEVEDVPSGAREMLASAMFILSSGVYGYISERTIGKLLAAVRDPGALWICNFALKPLDYRGTSEMLSSYGFVTETAPVLFPHRRFTSGSELAATVSFNAETGNDSTAETGNGYLHTRLYISRPARVAERYPLSEFWDREIPRHTASVLVPDDSRTGTTTTARKEQ